MSEDPHDWWNGICKRCGTSYTAFSNGEDLACREASRIVSQHAADDFAYIAKRNKEIAAELTPVTCVSPNVEFVGPSIWLIGGDFVYR